jgi:hypothetical protein
MKTNQKNNEAGKRPAKRKRETLKERVHRHLSDINSKITDDDIRNVRTELELRGETAPQTAETDNEENKPQKRPSRKQKKENETDSNKRKTSPWDILSEGYD